MKRNLAILAAIICLCGCDEMYTEFWSTASYATIDAITGDYSLVTATWDSPIDLSGEGLVTEDIHTQLQYFGWTGTQSIRYIGETEFVSVLNRSTVLTPQSPEWKTQINLYVPFPEYGKGKTEEPLKKSGRCNIDMNPYQFHYKVDSRGYISLYNIDDRQMSGNGGVLRNVTIRFEGEYIYFNADTSMYDWETMTWKDGHMSLKYRHN